MLVVKPLRNLKSQPGQMFVGIALLMVLALSIGITISTRFVKSLRITTQSDDSSRARGIAEALTERLLLVPNATLDSYIQFNSCGSSCTLQINDPTGQSLTATATLSYSGNSTSPYVINVTQKDPAQVSLSGYTSGKNVTVCWDNTASVYASYVNTSGSTVSSNAYAYNSMTSTHYDNGFSAPAAQSGHANCFNITATNTPNLVRFKSYYADTVLYIIPAPGQSIPKQGITIETKGVVGNATKTIRVLKTDPIMGSIFDYLLYQNTPDYPLSNTTI